MKGDLSRARFDVRRHSYTRVVAQQGRVQLDADWNEQQAIVDHRLRAALADIFGHGEPVAVAVAPHAAPGFGLHTHGGRVFGDTADAVWPAAPSLGDGPYTVEAWLKPAARDPGAPSGLRTVAGRFAGGDAPAGEFRVALDDDGCVVFERHQREPRGAPAPLRSRRPLRADAFSFVACVFTGDAVELWIDGELDRRAAAGSGAPDPAIPFRIGASGPAAGAEDRFAGTIEEVRVWRRRRLAHELAADYGRRGGYGDRPEHHDQPARADFTWTAADTPALPAAPRELCISPGRCYAGGWLCENRAHTPLAVPAAPAGEVTAYLDVWERYVSAFEDPQLADVALGGIDTSGRAETMARVRLTAPGGGLEDVLARGRDRGEIAVDVAGIVQDNLLYRFEVQAPGAAADGADPAGAVSVEPVRSAQGDGPRDPTLRVVGTDAPDWPSGQYLQALDPAVSGDLMRVVSWNEPGTAGERTFTVDRIPDGVYQPIAVRPVASVLWSRNNANLVFPLAAEPVTDGRKTTLVLRDEARRADQLSLGQLVVVEDAEHADSPAPGFVSTVVRISTDTPGQISLVLDGRLAAVAEPAVVRVWDGILPADARAGRAAALPGPDAGITVAFATAGTYRSGDFWTARLRADDLDAPLDWARDESGSAAFVPPHGVAHTYAELARIAVGPDGPRVERDLRRIVRAVADGPEGRFGPEPAAGEAPPQPVEPEPEQPPVEVGFGAPEHRHDHPHRPAPPPVIERVVVEPAPVPGLVLAHRQPPGYVPTGGVVEALVDRPAWVPDREAPDKGAAAAVTIDGAIYLLYERGTLWRRDPSHPDNPWDPCCPYEGVRRDYAVAAAAGQLYVLGGIGRDGRPSRRVDCYDPRTDTWSDMTPSMRAARTRFAAAGDERGIVVCGGLRRTWFGWWYASETLERFDVAAGAWQRLDPMPFRRYAAAAVVAGNALYLIGGRIVRGVVSRAEYTTARVDRRHDGSGGWSREALLHRPRAYPRAAAAGEDEIVVAGGAAGAAEAEAERIRLRSGEVRRIPSPQRGRCGLAAADGVVYAIAGRAEGADLRETLRCTVVDRIRVFRPDGEEE